MPISGAVKGTTISDHSVSAGICLFRSSMISQIQSFEREPSRTYDLVKSPLGVDNILPYFHLDMWIRQEERNGVPFVAT